MFIYFFLWILDVVKYSVTGLWHFGSIIWLHAVFRLETRGWQNIVAIPGITYIIYVYVF